MMNKSVKIAEPVFLSPTDIQYRMTSFDKHTYKYKFHILNDKNVNNNLNETGYVLKRKK